MRRVCMYAWKLMGDARCVNMSLPRAGWVNCIINKQIFDEASVRGCVSGYVSCMCVSGCT